MNDKICSSLLDPDPVRLLQGYLCFLQEAIANEDLIEICGAITNICDEATALKELATSCLNRLGAGNV